jgi:hypothetical protein
MRRYVNMAKSGRMAATRRLKHGPRPPLRNEPPAVKDKRKGALPGAAGRRRG